MNIQGNSIIRISNKVCTIVLNEEICHELIEYFDIDYNEPVHIFQNAFLKGINDNFDRLFSDIEGIGKVKLIRIKIPENIQEKYEELNLHYL